MARKIALSLLLSLVVLLAGSPVALAQPAEAPPTDSTGVCDLVGDAAGAAANFPLLDGLAEGATTSLCEHGGNPVTALADAAVGKFADAWESKFGEIVTWFLDGMAQLIMMSMSWWIKLPNPDLENMTSLQAISEYTFQIQLILLTASIIFVTMRVANARRHALAHEAEESFRILTRTVLAATLYSSLIAVLTKAGDAFSIWVVNETSNNDPLGVAESMLTLSTVGGMSPGLMIVIGIIGTMGALAQAVLLVIRQALLIVAVAVLPVAAAAGGTSVGQQSYQKLTAWVIAFLLFKPVAALAYGIAFLTAGHGADVLDGQVPTPEQFQQSLIGITLLAATAAVLPAIMRLITPAVVAAGSGGSGAAATAGLVMAGAALATGGKSLAAGKSAQGGAAGGAFSGGGPAGAVMTGGRGPSGGGGGGSAGGGRGGSPPPSGPTGTGRSSSNGSGSRGSSSSRSSGGGGRLARAGAAGMSSAERATREVTGGRQAEGPDMGRHRIPQ